MAYIRCDFRSEVLDMGTGMIAILPEKSKMKDINVVYLLHGLSDDCTGWSRYTRIECYAREYNVAVIMPEVQRSFYSDMVYGLKYFKFIHDELPKICSSLFGLSQKKEKCYIMGLSMGGYGSLKSMLTSPSRYQGCAAFSSVTDIEGRVATERFRNDFEAIFGNNLKIPKSASLYRLAEKQDCSKLPKIYMACGTEDYLFDGNKQFFEYLKGKGADLIFEIWKGSHEWQFWDSAVKRAFDFFFKDDV